MLLFQGLYNRLYGCYPSLIKYYFPKKPVILFINNNGAIEMTKTYQGYKRAKHINIWHHFVKEKIEVGKFKLVYVHSEDNVIDLLTKVLLRDATCNFTLDLRLWDTIGNRGDKWRWYVVIVTPGRVLDEISSYKIINKSLYLSIYFYFSYSYCWPMLWPQLYRLLTLVHYNYIVYIMNFLLSHI